MRPHKLIIVFLIFFNLSSFGQIGNQFWFAAPDVSASHYNNSIPLMLHITALHTTHVKISRPADPSFTPIEFDLGPQQTQEVRMDNDVNFNSLDVDDIETYARSTLHTKFIQDKGFLVESSPGEISAYYELVGQNNTDIIALKAHNALGKDFWVSTQRKYKNHGYSDDFSGFTIVATKNGTTIDIDPNGNNLAFHGTTPFTVTLNKGQAIAIRAAGQDPLLHIHGVKVESNQDIAIVIFDDSMQIDDGGGNWDIFADQIVPTSVVGKEYIILQGWVRDRATAVDGEAIFITPTENGTDIYIDGVQIGGTLNAGDYFQYEITNLSTHVRATKPVYVNHITGYSTNASITDGARELGGAILPPIDKCTGSHSVTVKRSPAAGFVYFNNLMVRNDTTTGSPTRNQAIHNFTYSINNGTPVAIDPTHFTYIMDSAFAVYDRFKAGGAAYYNNVIDGQILRVDNPMSRFHLGTMQARQSPGCKVGYFSDFAASDAAAGIGGFLQGNFGIYCNLNPIQLVANGGTTYKWYSPYEPTLIEKLNYDSIADPYFFPDTSGIFYFNVVVTGECQSKDTLTTEIYVRESASTGFSFSADEGCSPFDPLLTNFSDTVVGVNQTWTIRPAVGNEYEINQDTIPRTFELDLPENHTDSIQTHVVDLIVTGLFNSCPVKRTKDIKVLPQIEAGFTASDTVGCHPLWVDFTSVSTGNLDTNSYYWDFGDNTQSFDSIPSKNYSNYTLYDSTYNITLITESPFGCTDTARKNVVVHPRIRVNVAADTTTSCSPLVATLNPTASVGADTLWWNIDYFYADSVHKTTSTAPITLTHYDTSTASGPDTLYVQLIGSNRMGCMDTATTRRLISYPNVIAEFDVSDNDVCDSVPILFTNNSFGYKLNYDWDFGNNTYSQDSIEQAYTKVFFNRTDQDTVYTVRLRATSAYFCEDSKDTNITVHPYIKADFGMNYDNNCSPIHTQITNTSVRSQINWWDFGTGVQVIDNNTTIDRDFINSFPDKDTTIMVKLVVRNPEQCFDSLTRPLVLFPEVVANFDFTTDSIGCAPLSIGLENFSTGGNLTYTWDYGDNSSSTTNNATFSKIFNNVTATDTTYYVTLTARNLLGCDSVMTRPVEVFAFVDAEFSLPVADSCSPFTIRPANLSSNGAHVFNWDFGNGNTDTIFEPVVPTYIEQDETVRYYDVELIAAGASDPAHLLCADTHTVSITIYPELEADIIMGDTVNCHPLVSTLTNNSNLIPNTSFNWYIDNLFYSSDQTPPDLTQTNTRNYDTTHTVILYGRSEHGCRDTATQDIYIYSLVDAFFSLAPSSICSGDSFQIDQTYTSGGITHRTWDFFGEDTSNTASSRFYHLFENTASSSPITKEVSLTVYNNHNCSDTWVDTVVVYPQVTADFNPDVNAICYPHNSQFTNNSINANRANWSFGDGASSIETDPVYRYNNFSPVTDNTYNVKLTATSNYNCFDTITKQVTIYAKPDADFYFPVAVACPPFNVDMINNSQGSNLTYNWDFSGEETSTELNPNYTFSNSGSSIDERPITLIVNSDRSCSDTLVKSVNVYPDVNVDFEYSINEGCSPLDVTLTGDTSNVLQMIWYVDGKAFSTVKDASYYFVNETPGDKVFDVRFYAQSLYDCSADTTKQITVFSSPIAEFIPMPLPAVYDTINDRTTINFNNQTVFQDNWSYEWNFGDGTINNELTGAFDYTYGESFWGSNENGNRIPVQLVAWNTSNPACRDTTNHDIIITPPFPQVDVAEDLVGCEPFTVDLSATTKYIEEDDYLWEFGIEGETSTEPSPSYTFTEPGIYTVKLEVHGDGGTNLDYKIVTVNPKPEVAFTFNDSIVFDSSATKGYDWINFYNQSKYATSYAWYFNIEDNFGGIPDSEERDPSWYYTEVGDYYVGLIAKSGEGCMDTLSHPTPIKVETEGSVRFPTAFFVSPDGPGDSYDTDTKTNKYVFYPVTTGVDEYRLEIYNRWGARVFDTKDPEYGWNGYIDGSPAKQDVYIWRARGRYRNGQAFDISGDVTLLYGLDNIVPD